ncbi:MAG: hypothetical protein J6Y25_01675 [Elusimicrobiaceae bacterium]|nr:hypothetical protein [Elusimicrobiaceae bacterium]MBP5616430.1 hypothetical protein [Elusimicrobiaceae bacterium]
MKKSILICLGALLLAACATTNQVALESKTSQVATRNYQTRSFDTTDKVNVMNNIVATMQDLGFVIEKADKEIGTISGFSFTNQTTMTVSVRPQGKSMIVRANASKGTRAITEPQAYQNFFNALSQSLFLTANEVL